MKKKKGVLVTLEIDAGYVRGAVYGKKSTMNAYRVLLTRARAGMIICVPEGNSHKTVSGFWEDSTRLPEYYDGTCCYLQSLGLEEI